MSTVRLTVAQAVVRFLSQQYSERDGMEQRLIEGCWGIFGHGNVAGLGEALLEAELHEPGTMPYWTGRNEQGMVHAAVGFARMRDRLSTLAVTASVGPGATNLVTGAALATINRLPVLLLPGDTFATRASAPVLQELEVPSAGDLTVNDALRPVSKYFDRIQRPEQLTSALLAAMRVLSDPVETGAVTLCLPQDVQAEAWDWPEELFQRRVWHVARTQPEPVLLARAAAALRAAKRPVLVAGGGVIYSGATEELAAFAQAAGVPVVETQAGKGAMRHDHPLAAGAVGHTGSTAANALARSADLVLAVGTRLTDFTTASMTLFQDPDVRFINLNVAGQDASKASGMALVADAKEGLRALRLELGDHTTSSEYLETISRLVSTWNHTVDAAQHAGHGPLPSQAEVLGAVNDSVDARDVVVCAAGSMPGDLHKMWRCWDPKAYHVEYGFSCMGYEIAGGLGVKMAAPDRGVVVMVGDGSYLMMAQELATAVQEGIELMVVLVQNHGFASIGALSESLGAQRFGTSYRKRNTTTGRLDGEPLPVDLALNAQSLGAHVLRAHTIPELRDALEQARAHRGGPVVIHIETDPLVGAPDSEAWWDVAVSAVSRLESTQQARLRYESHKGSQRQHLSS